MYRSCLLTIILSLWYHLVASAWTAPSVASRTSSGSIGTVATRRLWGQETAQMLVLPLTLPITALLLATPPARAIPMVTTEQFRIIVRDSARSIDRVEFRGPQNVNVMAVLVDGTQFIISDVVESPVDPRSPLQIAAICRENAIQTRFVDLEAVLAKTPKRTKLYTNARVQEAQIKEKEKQARMAQDEAEYERQRLLQQQQQQVEAVQRLQQAEAQGAVNAVVAGESLMPTIIVR